MADSHNPPDTHMDPNVVFSGYLDKSPPLNKTLSGLKAFKTRFFVLRRDSTLFQYFDGPKLTSLKGEIDMEGAVKIEANQEWTGPQKGKHPFVFTIETKSGRTYYLSASSKEVMINWVDKLSSTFKFYLLNNNDDPSASSVIDTGVVPVNISLISSEKVTATVQCTDSTTALDVLLESLKKAGKDQASAPLYSIVAVNIKTETARPIKADQPPLPILRSTIDNHLYVVHNAEAHYVVKLIKLEESKVRIERGEVDNTYEVFYLGSHTLPASLNPKKAPPAEIVVKSYDQLVKQARAYKAPLKMHVSLNGIKVVTPTGNPKSPYVVVLEQSLHGIANCLDIDKSFAFVSAPSNVVPVANTAANASRGIGDSEFKLYAFKCVDKKMAEEIRDVVTRNCNQMFAMLHEAAKNKQQPVGAMLRTLASGVAPEDIPSAKVQAPVAAASAVPPAKLPTAASTSSINPARTSGIEFEAFDATKIEDLLRSVELPSTNKDRDLINKFLDGDFPDEDEE